MHGKETYICHWNGQMWLPPKHKKRRAEQPPYQKLNSPMTTSDPFLYCKAQRLFQLPAPGFEQLLASAFYMHLMLPWDILMTTMNQNYSMPDLLSLRVFFTFHSSLYEEQNSEQHYSSPTRALVWNLAPHVGPTAPWGIMIGSKIAPSLMQDPASWNICKNFYHKQTWGACIADGLFQTSTSPGARNCPEQSFLHLQPTH